MTGFEHGDQRQFRNQQVFNFSWIDLGNFTEFKYILLDLCGVKTLLNKHSKYQITNLKLLSNNKSETHISKYIP